MPLAKLNMVRQGLVASIIAAALGLSGCSADPLASAVIELQTASSALVGSNLRISGTLASSGDIDELLTATLTESLDGAEQSLVGSVLIEPGTTGFSFDDIVQAEGQVRYRVSISRESEPNSVIEAGINVLALNLAEYIDLNLESNIVVNAVRQEPSGDRTRQFLAGDMTSVETDISWSPGTELATRSTVTLVESESSLDFSEPGLGQTEFDWLVKTESPTVTQAKFVLRTLVEANGQSEEVIAEYPVSYLNLTNATDDFIDRLEALVRVDMTEALALAEEFGAPIFVDPKSEVWQKTKSHWAGKTFNAFWGDATERIEYFSYESSGPCSPEGLARAYSSEAARPFHIFVDGKDGAYRMEGLYKNGKVYLNVVGAFCQP